jgi:tRNA 2-selenouridine synthase
MREPHYILSETPFPTQQWLVVDVRSPGEFARGHLPGAVNIPLLNNEERAEVGTLYKRSGRAEALVKGLERVGPKMATWVTTIQDLRNNRPLLIYCWRGGMRSNSFGWLMRTAGFPVTVVEGGYKAWRKQVHHIIRQAYDLRILTGYTGSAKTEVLHELSALGHQSICLESLAHHKGSAFGGLGQAEQPTTESFENRLAEALYGFNPAKPIWMEDESISIGKVYLPQALYQRMQVAPHVRINIPHHQRLDHIVKGYGQLPTDELKAAFDRISKRMGPQHAKAAKAFLDHNNLREAANLALTYYDQAYLHSLNRKSPAALYTLEPTGHTPAQWAQYLHQWITQTSN